MAQKFNPLGGAGFRGDFNQEYDPTTDTIHVLKAGDTMSGSLILPAVTNPNGQGLFVSDGTAKILNYQGFTSGGTTYAFFGTNRTYTGGGWTGTGFYLNRRGATLQVENDLLAFYQFVANGTGPSEVFRIGTSGATLHTIQDPAIVGLTVKGYASQTANLTNWTDSANTVMTSIDPAGRLIVPIDGGITVNAGANNFMSFKDTAGQIMRLGRYPAWTDSGVTAWFQMSQLGGTHYAMFTGASGTNLDRMGIVSTTTVISDLAYNSMPVTSNTILHVQSSTATSAGIVVKGATSQSANLQEWKNSSNTVLTSITNDGNIKFGGNFNINNTIITGVDIMDVKSQSGSQAFRVIPGASPTYSLFNQSTATFFEFHRNSGGTDRMFLTAPVNANSGYQFTSYNQSSTPGPFVFSTSQNAGTRPDEIMRLGTTGATIGSTAYSTGTIAQTGTSITGTGTTWTDDMTGGTITYSDGTYGTFTYASATTGTSSLSKSVTAGSTYVITFGNLSVSSDGTTLKLPAPTGVRYRPTAISYIANKIFDLDFNGQVGTLTSGDVGYLFRMGQNKMSFYMSPTGTTSLDERFSMGPRGGGFSLNTYTSMRNVNSDGIPGLLFQGFNDAGTVQQFRIQDHRVGFGYVPNTYTGSNGNYANSQATMYIENNRPAEPNLIIRAASAQSSDIVDVQDNAGTTNLLKVTSDGTLSTNGNLIAAVAGKGLRIKEGSNAKMGTATLSAGTVTVSTTAVTANSRIFLTVQSLGTVATPKAVAVTTVTAGASFVITSADATDTSVVAWHCIEPA